MHGSEKLCLSGMMHVGNNAGHDWCNIKHVNMTGEDELQSRLSVQVNNCAVSSNSAHISDTDSVNLTVQLLS